MTYTILVADVFNVGLKENTEIFEWIVGVGESLKWNSFIVTQVQTSPFLCNKTNWWLPNAPKLKADVLHCPT